LRGLRLREESKFAEAKSAFMRAIDLDSMFVPAYINMGRLLVEGVLPEGRDYDGAIEMYWTATRYNSKAAGAYINWGVGLSGKHDNDGAIRKYRKAIEIDPKSALAYTNWGAALETRKDYDGAVAKYQMALEVDPKYADAYAYWGDVLRTRKDFEGAIAKY